MSLHIGNISSRIRRGELEHVFRRFGRCSVRLKDGYGFVVYEFPPHAEKALRALHRSYICGEQLTLSWSNKQPRPFKGCARAGGSYEAQHGRDTGQGEEIIGINLADSNDHGDSRMNIVQQPDTNVGRIGSAHMLSEEIAYHQDGIKDFIRGGHDYREDVLEGHMGGCNPIDDDRWGNQFHDPLDGNGVDNGLEFDRYEPNKDYDEKNDDYNHQIAYAGGSALRNSHNIGRVHIGEGTSMHPNDAKMRGNCYQCGGLGHKMRNCPQKNSSRRNLTSFNHRHGIDRRGRDTEELERFRSRSREGLRSSRDASLNKTLMNDTKPASGARAMIGGSYQGTQETDRSVRKDHGGKKRNKKEIGSPKRLNTKKARRSVSSAHRSDYTPSKLQTTLRSSKQVPRSGSYSRLGSLSSRGNSRSFHSRSSSASLNSGSRSIRSKSRSRSSSPTSLSLSVSLGRPLPSSSNKAQLIPKSSVDNTPESKEILIELEQTEKVDTQLEDTKLEDELPAVNNNTAVSHSRVESEIEKNEPLNRDSCSYQMASRPPNKGTDLSTELADKGITTERSYKEILTETGDCPNPDALATMHSMAPAKKPDSEAAAMAYSSDTASLTTEELFMVLKHYGFEIQEEHNNHTAEAYFGSARLWPFEIIYYRRLKKGPITLENYARRVEQNKEFGIVDKYVRSSSGWAEMSQGNL